MSGRRLVLINHAADAAEQGDDTDYVALDPSWTPAPGERPDVRPIRGPLWAVIRERDVNREVLAALDDWAERAGMAARLRVGGTSWWYHIRAFIRLDLHEMVLWLRVLDGIAPRGQYERIEVPSDRPWLLAAVEAARAGGAGAGATGAKVVEREARTSAPPFRGGKPAISRLTRRRPWLVRMGARAMRTARRVLDVPGRARTRLQRERFGRLVLLRPAVLAVVRVDSFHQVEGPDGGGRSDPLVTPVLGKLAALHRSTATVVLGSMPEGGEQGLRDEAPMPIAALTSVLTSKAERRDSREDFAGRLAGIQTVPLLIGGADLGPTLVSILSGLDKWFAGQRRELLVAERVLATLRPRVLLTGWEASRTAWLEAARASGVQTVSIQHGVIYANSPDYYRRPGPGLVRPTVMCVYGAYERRLLVEECGYPPGAVVATGSPRITSEAATAADPEARAQLRRSLGLSDFEQMLVITGARHAVGEGLVSTTIYAGLLDGELPGIHLVVKLHPEEDQGDHYAALIEGLARAGGYRPPPVTVVRHVDLFQLLGAADAHLGIYSTVLTDGVVAGTPTMVASGQEWADLIGYVAAGVAQPVASVDDVRRFMRNPWVPSAQAREAFIREHFEPGDGAARIARIVDALAAERSREDPTSAPSRASEGASPGVQPEGRA